MLEAGISLPGQNAVHLSTYESNVLFALRFMIDTGLVGGSWVELPAGSYVLAQPNAPATYCQIEAHVKWDKFIAHAPEGG